MTLSRWFVLIVGLTVLITSGWFVVAPLVSGCIGCKGAPIDRDPATLVLNRSAIPGGYQLVENKSGGDLLGEFQRVPYKDRVSGYQSLYGNPQRGSFVVGWAQLYTDSTSAAAALAQFQGETKGGFVGLRNFSETMPNAQVSGLNLGGLSGFLAATPSVRAAYWVHSNVLELVLVENDPNIDVEALALRQDAMIGA